MALDNNTVVNYTDKTTIKNWFKTGLKPTQKQFWSTGDSFWHKSESLPISSISGLGALIDSKSEENHEHNEYAKNDATSLTADNITAWQQKLGVADLKFDDKAITTTQDYADFGLQAGATINAFNNAVYEAITGGEFGKNFSNTDLVVSTNRKHTGTASVELAMPMIYSNASQRFSGLIDKSADATYNALLGMDSSGNLAKVNGKNVFINQPDNLTDAEKTAWKTKMNGGYTTATMNVSIITPNVVKKDAQVEKNIILRGSNLNINPASFSVSVLDTNKVLVYTLNNSKVKLISTSELSFWVDTTKIPLNSDLFLKINNGIAEYITPVSFQLRSVVDDIDFSVLTWTKHYKSDYVQSGIDYAEGTNAGIEYNETTNNALLGTSLVASLHSSNIPLLSTDDFSISFNSSLQNLSSNVAGILDTVTPKVGIYIGDKPSSLSNVISYGVYYTKSFTQSSTDSQIGLIGGGYNNTALSSPVEAQVTINKQNSNLTVSISFKGNTLFLVSTFPFTPTNKIGFSLMLGGQLRRSNLSIKNIQGYKY